MHAHSVSPAPRTPALVRSGVTASAVALILAGFATSAAAQDQPDTPSPVPQDASEAVGAQGSPSASAEPRLYQVAPGDSLSAIAGAHGLDPVSGWKRLFDANPEIVDPNLIVPGQVVRLPTPDEELPPRALPAPPPATTPPASTGNPAASPQQPTSAPTTQPQVATSAPAGVWDRLAQCESGGNWHINTGNGYYGGLQFSASSWQAVGGSGLPHEASRDEQIRRGQQLQAAQGWGAWPSCARQLGLR